MEIVFFVLKTAGIILLIILGLLVLLAALLLLVPIRYRIEGHLPEEGDPRACIRFTWLFHLVSFQAEYADGLRTVLRAAGLPVHPEKWRRKRRAEGVSDGRTAPDGEDRQDVLRTTSPSREGEAGTRAAREENSGEKTMREEPSFRKEASEAVTSQQKTEKGPKMPGAEQQKEEENRPDRWAALQNRLERFAESLKDAGQALESLAERAERIRNAAAYYRRVLTAEDSRMAVGMIWEHLKGLAGHARPKTFSAELTVGAEDPSVTGKVLAVHGMLYPWIGESVCIHADFERECLYGELYAAGRVRACVALYHILRVVLDKRTWTLFRRLKKEELTNG
ncbi:MAG TPA: DUF2953 domain-containing protein [Candidatus Eisenbergiella intestinipullorum]|nr:DUF2953 domain-containing protein [Candidatus Eisenbergiella intestinipullorum]